MQPDPYHQWCYEVDQLLHRKFPGRSIHDYDPAVPHAAFMSGDSPISFVARNVPFSVPTATRPSRFGVSWPVIGVIWLISLGVAFYAGREHLRNELVQSLSNAFRQPSDQPVPAPAPPADSAGEIVKTTPEELVRFFADNQVKATDWIKGKRIEISAPLYTVSNNFFGGDKAAVVFEAQTGSFLKPKVAFWFDGEYRKRLGDLRDGQRVTCVGVFEEQEFGGDLQFRGTELR